jgi:ribonuclease HII
LVSASIIDAKGISHAIRSGIKNCLKKVKADPKKTLVLLDGSLKAPAEFIYQKTIIRGDATEPAISMAAIAAKVTRDRMMKKMALIHRFYGFEIHKGYGTAAHRAEIRLRGPSPVHRISFLKNILQKEPFS